MPNCSDNIPIHIVSPTFSKGAREDFKGKVWRCLSDKCTNSLDINLNTDSDGAEKYIRATNVGKTYIKFEANGAGDNNGVSIYWHCTSEEDSRNGASSTKVGIDQLLIDVISGAYRDGNLSPFKLNLTQYYYAWNGLYGVNDMRPIWFDVTSNPTEVELVLQVKEILDLDLATTDLSISAVLDIEWIDPRLNWSGFCKDKTVCPSDYEELVDRYNLLSYSHIPSVQLQSDQIWVPKIYVYAGEMIDTTARRGTDASLPLTVSINGHVTMKRYVTIKTPCSVNTGKYPFDIQQCNIKFGVRDLKDDQVKLKITKMNYYSIRTGPPSTPSITDLRRYLGMIRPYSIV